MQKKYFIAIVPPAPVLEEIEALKQELYNTYGLKGALRSPAHITLHRPFEWKEEKEDQLIQTLSEFTFNDRFSIELRNFDCFEPRVIFIDVVKNEALNLLHTQLTSYARKNLKLLNESEDMRGFHPHVTVAFRDLKKQKFYELKKEFHDKKFSGIFDYNELALLKLNEKWEVVFKIKKPA